MKTIVINDHDLKRVAILLADHEINFAVGNAKEGGALLNVSAPNAPERDSALRRPRRTKEARADLEALVEAGAIKAGEVLELHDYRGEKVDGCEARVAGKGLLHNGRHHSMSDLAQLLLTRYRGYKKTSIRGPAHWFTKNGRSIRDLWDELKHKLD